MKREDLQCSGSFKWRGVIGQLRATEHVRGLVCVSTGNTGKAVAKAASELQMPAHVFCCTPLEPLKHAYVTEHGGTVHICALTFSAATRTASQYAEDRGMAFFSPGSNWDFVRGVGGIALEIADQAPQSEAVYIPIGGGGLASAIGTVYGEQTWAAPRLVGVQAANSPHVYDLFHATGPTIEQATGANCLAGDLEDEAIIKTVLHDVLDDVVLLSEGQLHDGARHLARAGVAVELGAAAAFIAAKAAGGSWARCAIVSGQ